MSECSWVCLSRVRSATNEGEELGINTHSKKLAVTVLSFIGSTGRYYRGSLDIETVRAYRYFRPGVGTTNGDKTGTRATRLVLPT
jgi:hypothetical protein